MVLLWREPGKAQLEARPEAAAGLNAQVTFHSLEGGRLEAATAFLTGRWFGAQAEIVETADGPVVQITQGPEVIRVPLP
jgi:hypothetical protein